MATTDNLTIRPVRPNDRKRVIEITRDIWDGHDYVPRVFDDWVSEAGAAFQAIELDGVVVGLQRLRPYSSGLDLVRGPSRREHAPQAGPRTNDAAICDHGGARAVVSRDAPGHGQPGGRRRLFEELGFIRIQDDRWWKGGRVEGGESARMPEPVEAEKLWSGIATSPGIDLWGGVTADFNGAHDLGSAELSRLAGVGMLRVGPGGRAIAGLREPWANNLAVAFIAGKGGALRELLLALRFEADADGLDDVTLALPRDHPAIDDLHATGYDFANDDDHSYIYSLKLTP